MKNIAIIKLLSGAGLMTLVLALDSCCTANVNYWDEIKLVLMGFSAVLFVLGSNEMVKPK